MTEVELNQSLDFQLTKLSEYYFFIKDKFIRLEYEVDLEENKAIELDKECFCLLWHSALEHFFENLAIEVVDTAINKFETKGEITLPLLSLAFFYSDKKIPSEDSEELIFVNYFKIKLNEMKTKFYNEVSNNNGISPKFLKNLLLPIAVDFPIDVVYTESIKNLSNYRGQYAHNTSALKIKLKIIKNPSIRDIINISEDSLKMARIVVDNAKKTFQNNISGSEIII
jgi:hypothetical protein